MTFQYVVIITKDVLCQFLWENLSRGVNNYGEDNPAYTLFRNSLRWEIGVAIHLYMFEFQLPSLDGSGRVVLRRNFFF